MHAIPYEAKLTLTLTLTLTVTQVHAIPYEAKKRGLLTVEKQGKINVFSGRILEIEGLGHLKCEQVSQ